MCGNCHGENGVEGDIRNYQGGSRVDREGFPVADQKLESGLAEGVVS